MKLKIKVITYKTNNMKKKSIKDINKQNEIEHACTYHQNTNQNCSHCLPQNPSEFPVCDTPKFNIYINGVYHWKAEECIISFDMADELFSTLPLPSNFSSCDNGCWDLGLLNGSPTVMNYPSYDQIMGILEMSFDIWELMGIEMRFDIWVMKEYGIKESWTKQLTIGPIFGNYRPFGFWKNGGLFLQSLDYEQLVLYDPNTREIEKLQVHSLRTMSVLIYVEILVPINERGEHEDEGFIRLPAEMGDE